MNRLQKKCVIASAGMHGLLLVALLFGSAFFAPSRESPDLEVLTVIPDVLTDAPFFNTGGKPEVKQPPALPPSAVPQPPPPRQQPVVKPPEPAPPKSTPQKPPEESDPTKPSLGKRMPEVNTQMSVRKADARARDSSDDTSKAEARAAADARRNAVARALAGVGSVASSSMAVEIPGFGGQAFANYAQAVKSRYTQAWVVPTDVDDDQATTKASVTIRRDGTVAEARIIKPSGNAAVDASVQRTLERVTFVAPFPEGAKESQRTFTISFNLKAKRQLR